MMVRVHTNHFVHERTDEVSLPHELDVGKRTKRKMSVFGLQTHEPSISNECKVQGVGKEEDVVQVLFLDVLHEGDVTPSRLHQIHAEHPFQHLFVDSLFLDLDHVYRPKRLGPKKSERMVGSPKQHQVTGWAFENNEESS